MPLQSCLGTAVRGRTVSSLLMTPTDSNLEASLPSFPASRFLLTSLAAAWRHSYSDSRTEAPSAHPLWWSNKARLSQHQDSYLLRDLLSFGFGVYFYWAI